MLLILDGWGIREETPGNAIKLAHPTFYDSLLANYPNTALDASGEAVGLPDGQMGNSEVGHLNMRPPSAFFSSRLKAVTTWQVSFSLYSSNSDSYR